MQLLDHVSLTVRDIEDAKRFYKAIFAVLEADVVYEQDDAIGFGPRNGPGDSGHTYLSIFASKAAKADPRRHVAFRARSVEQVRAFHRAGLATGGRSDGEPGPRDYHEGYYATFLLDPEGNKVEAVFHAATRVAPGAGDPPG